MSVFAILENRTCRSITIVVSTKMVIKVNFSLVYFVLFRILFKIKEHTKKNVRLEFKISSLFVGK